MTRLNTRTSKYILENMLETWYSQIYRVGDGISETVLVGSRLRNSIHIHYIKLLRQTVIKQATLPYAVRVKVRIPTVSETAMFFELCSIYQI